MDRLELLNEAVNTALLLNGLARILNGFTSRLELLNETMNTTLLLNGPT